MKYSRIGLKVLAAKECGIIKSNATFQTEFPNQKKFEEIVGQHPRMQQCMDELEKTFEVSKNNEGFICAFDEQFPVINSNVKNSEKPFLIFYKGDISLLKDLNNNIAVIGLTDPTPEIEKREIQFVKCLVDNDLVIVSGLAKGCDTIAHQVCINEGKKTIAILPTPINKIAPATNRKLAQEIVERDGLLLSEYYKEPRSKHETIARYIERDRLQAMFSKAIILTASYRKGEGDSGSRHAMEAAKKYKIDRYVLFNEVVDMEDKQFGLNKDLIISNHEKVKTLHSSSIETIKTLVNPTLSSEGSVQLTLL